MGGAPRDGTLPGGFKIYFLSPCRHLSHAQGCHLLQRECQRATSRPLVHERPPVTGPARGGQWPKLLCDLHSARATRPSSLDAGQGQAVLWAPSLLTLRSLFGLTSHREPRRAGVGALGA